MAFHIHDKGGKMGKKKRFQAHASFLVPAFLSLASMQPVFGHCDGLDGPVVTAARLALDSNQVERVLIWVPASDEGVIKDSFRKTLSVRKLGTEAKDLADLFFFETIVRLHRASEGAPFTGLRPPGADLGPAIPAADKALQTGKLDPLMQLLDQAYKRGLKEAYENARTRKQFPMKDVGKGREYVSSYVEYIHFVERIYEAAAKPAEGHFEEHDRHSMEAGGLLPTRGGSGR